jgi:hypothetical protein
MGAITQFLKDYGELISITLIPIIIFYVGKRLQDRDAKRNAKQDLFLRLMANRKKNPPTIEWADSLNQIDIIFQDSKNVRRAWRTYYDSLHPYSQHFSNSNSFLLDLLSEIANELGYRNLKQTELDRFYSPVFFDNQVKNQDLMYKEYLRVLQRSKSLSEPFSEEEFVAHVEKNKVAE